MDKKMESSNFSLRDSEEAYLFNTGEHFFSYQFMGCHAEVNDGVKGFRFTVWAPNAKAVALVGDFCNWDQGIEMSLLETTGIWSIFTELAKEGDFYKYRVHQADDQIKLKIDPYGFEFELRPGEATVVKNLPRKKWQDSLWRARKKRNPIYQRPLNIYEVHAGSWKQDEFGEFLNFNQLADELIPYVKKMGYTHIEFLPLMEHPLDASWGYQLTGYYAISSRFGTLEEFMEFIDRCHQSNVGVLMDWVPGHFCKNEYGLAYFDGTPQFEYKYKSQAENVRWGTLNFNLGSPQVQSFLISNALFWLDYCHLDGIRVDAVSNMLYLDYDEGEWIPNEDGSNHNVVGVEFIKKLNTTIFNYQADSLMIAEESTAWEKVTAPVHLGGLGFNYKWNMGWMNDILRFFEMDPMYRPSHFEGVTFSFIYMFNEQFILPLSHDEVVHGKKSLMHKMPGDRYNQFANLRVLMAYLISHPGKKLLFMGSEWGQFLEWKAESQLEWVDLSDEMNGKMQLYTKRLNQIYQEHRAFWELDHTNQGIQILDANTHGSGILSFIRKGKKPRDFVLIICNFMPIQQEKFTIGVPFDGTYSELLNTEMLEFGGTWVTGQGDLKTINDRKNDQPYSLELILPAMSILILKPKRISLVQKDKPEVN